MKRIRGIPLTSEPHGVSADPAGMPPGPPRDASGTLGTPLDPSGKCLRLPGDAPGTPGDFQGPLMDHKNGHSSTNFQCQKLLIVVFEPACWDPSHEGHPSAILS